jgi:hypothetical protein
MADIILARNVALREILAGLFPNVALSGVGVSLLAAQIDALEKECATIRGYHNTPKKARARNGSALLHRVTTLNRSAFAPQLRGLPPTLGLWRDKTMRRVNR